MSHRVITCPSCGAKYRIPETFTGSKAKCKKCSTVIEVPPPGEEPVQEEIEESPPPPPREKPTRAGRSSTRRGRTTRSRREEPAEEEAPGGGSSRSSRSGGGRARGRSRPARGGRGGRAGGGRRRGGGEEGEEFQEGGSNQGVIIAAVAAVVIVVVVAVYFLFLKEPTPTGPTPEEIAAKKKAEEEREAAERKEAERLAAARREAERREAERREAERKAAEAKKASGEGKPKPAPKPAEASRPPIKDVDLDSLEPLDYAPGTSDNKKTEIDDLIQVVKEPYAGARGARARRKLVEIGYYAVPRIINILIKADYYSQDGVETAYALCRNLEDICEGLGYKVMTARDKKLDKPAWESEYYIKYNRQVAHSWYKLWKDQGGSRTSWEKYFKDLRSKEKGKEKDTKEKF